MSGLDGELLLTALTTEQQHQFCEAAHTALNAVPTETLCGMITSLAPDEAMCSDIYGRCVAARPTFACGTSFPEPSDERVAEHCPGITVAEAEHAVSTMFGWILGFDGPYCAIPDDARGVCTAHPADIPETDRDALNCYYNTALLPIRQPSPT